MGRRAVARAGALVALGAALAGPAGAQFAPDFNHLFCHAIHETDVQTFVPQTVDLETQFGVELGVTIMRPSYLCAPARKTPAAPDPVPPIAVPHFTCYRPAKGPARQIAVRLTDQFGSGVYTVTSRRLVCTPTVKEIVGSPSGAFL
jgi:hypothetical protein